MKYALSALPETFINMLQVCSLFLLANLYVSSSFVQSFVSLRRIEKYLNGAEIITVPLLDQQQSKTVAFKSCTLTWPQDRNASSLSPSVASTPKHKFVLVDLSLNFPQGELSLICGKLGSGKTLLLLGKPFSSFRSSHFNLVLSIRQRCWVKLMSLLDKLSVHDRHLIRWPLSRTSEFAKKTGWFLVFAHMFLRYLF